MTAAAVALLVLPSSVAAQEFEGRWEAEQETPRGTMTQTLTLSRDGDEWSGTLSFMRREAELTQVEVEGARITFTVELEMRGPRGGGGTVAQTFKGVLEGDRITGEMEGPRGARALEFVRVTAGG